MVLVLNVPAFLSFNLAHQAACKESCILNLET